MSEQLRFYKVGENEAGAAVYRLVIDGKTVKEDLSIDEVVRLITRRDEDQLGEEHGRSVREWH